MSGSRAKGLNLIRNTSYRDAPTLIRSTIKLYRWLLFHTPNTIFHPKSFNSFGPTIIVRLSYALYTDRKYVTAVSLHDTKSANSFEI